MGCDIAIDYSQGDWVKQVRDATGGEGVTVVYDAVGKDTFMGSLDCAQTFGLVVLRRGVRSGAGHRAGNPEQEGLPVPDPALGVPAQCGPARFRANAKDLFDATAAGHGKVESAGPLPSLAEVAVRMRPPSAAKPPAPSCSCRTSTRSWKVGEER